MPKENTHFNMKEAWTLEVIFAINLNVITASYEHGKMAVEKFLIHL